MEKSYLFDDRDIIIPVPRIVPEWTRVEGNITAETQGILDKLVDRVHEVSIFSWHPNIVSSQYSDDPEDYRYHNNNYNSRIRLGNNIVIQGIDDTLDRGYHLIRNSISHVKEMRTEGGSGDLRNGYQAQISFLVTVRTHEESNDLKNRLITHGAYSFRDGEWWYVPAQLFDPYLEERKIVKERIEEICNIFNHHSSVKSSVIPSNLVSLYLEGVKKYYSVIRVHTDQPARHVHVFRSSYRTHVSGQSDKDFSFSHLRNVLEFFPDVFSEEEIDLLSENPQDYKRILHDHRGKVAARKFEF